MKSNLFKQTIKVACVPENNYAMEINKLDISSDGHLERAICIIEIQDIMTLDLVIPFFKLGFFKCLCDVCSPKTSQKYLRKKTDPFFIKRRDTNRKFPQW